MTKQIPLGYKQTKVGVIPEDWEVVKLGDVLNYEQPSKYLVNNDDYCDKYDLPVLTAGKTFILGYTNEKNGIYNDLPVIIFDDFTTSNHYVNFKFKIKSSAIKLLVSRQQNLKYLYEQMQLVKFSLGDEHKRYWISEYSQIKIPLPPLKEQEKIAEILSTWDDAITKQEQLIEQKQVFKKGIMQQIFSQRLRFIEFKENWKTVNVGSFMIERNKQIPKSDKYPLMAFAAYKGVTEKGDRYDREFLVTDEENKKYKQTEYGDFIYSSNNLETGSIGLNKYGSATISPVYSIFQIMKSSDYIFISNLLVTKKFINSMVRYRQGVMYGQWRIHESDFLKIKVSIPCLEEQTKIADFLTSIDDEISKQTEILEQLKLQKQSLMQKLLTGQVRCV